MEFKKMNRQEFAEMLEGRLYREEMDRAEDLVAKQNELLVVFGASDDLMEFRGIIYDEIGADNGTTAYFHKDKSGKIILLDEELTQAYNYFNVGMINIEAIWSPDEPECSWVFKTDIPHSKFKIMEDSELYCVGIVIEQKDLLDALSVS